MSEELQQRTESLRRMVETRDLIIKDLEREIRELKYMLNGVPARSITTSICPHHSDSEPPWMCACTQRTLEASRLMVETRDRVIVNLHRENRELKDMLHGVADPSWRYRG